MDDDDSAAWAQLDNEARHWHEERATAAHNTWFEEYEETVMKTSEMIQSKFMKKEEFQQSGPRVMTIKGVSVEEVGRGDTRWVLHFNESTKGIVLNVSKIKALESAFGDDSDYWIGKKIKVEHDPGVMMGQQVVGGIKFTMPRIGTVVPKPAPAPVVVGDGFEDEIPF